MTLTGTFDTPNASKYLQQLCKHFGHKTEVEFTETEGRANMSVGALLLTADDAALTARFELASDDHEDRAKTVVDKHLARFAFREDFTAMTWTTT